MTAAVVVRVCANPNCGKDLVRRDNEGVANWTRRRYCCMQCSADDRSAPGRAKARREVANDRRCAWAGCGGPLKRRVGERTKDWLDRRFCCKQCHESRYIPVLGRVAKPVFPVVVADKRDQSWKDVAACRGADPNRFGPIEKHERTGMDRCRRAAAQFCQACPVAAACHRYAEAGDEQGVWAARLRQNRNGKVVVQPLFGAPAEEAVSA